MEGWIAFVKMARHHNAELIVSEKSISEKSAAVHLQLTDTTIVHVEAGE
jgi:hypothetical protein